MELNGTEQTNQMMSLKDWIITIILIALPIVSLIMLIIWATDKKDPRNNFAKAYLIVMGGIFALVMLFYVLMLILFLFIGIAAQ
ncbi:hypothetical protein H9649_15560 [Sporosarcina sp. Sa2YVA2]|uniref:DUF2768 domain-containing protein n=1 Tax=Sporosarcina quadrami TaxID=2762234 RepID=A0ABR8UD71_9BACL|nr:hypothetical protein [Sporosarcina quadrami]MBD7985988.1 hypothetical protein [Sporosarcina quadrami]